MKSFVIAVLCLGSIILGAITPGMPSTAVAGEASSEAFSRLMVPWSVIGTWDCIHPAWSGTITIAPDGTFAREHGDAGRWTLAGLQGEVVLVLAWNDWSPETAAMIGPDEFRGKIRTETNRGELVMRRHVQTDDAVEVLAASYSFGSQYVDVTKRVQGLLREGKTFQADPTCLLADPHPYWNKALVIFCKVWGKPAIFSVGEGEDVSHELLLKNARVLDKGMPGEKKDSDPE